MTPSGSASTASSGSTEMYDREEQAAIAVFEKALETFVLEDILADNDLTPAEALFLLAEAGHIEYPETHPV